MKDTIGQVQKQKEEISYGKQVIFNDQNQVVLLID